MGRKCSGQHISFSTPSKDASNLLSRHRALRRQSACHPPAGSSGPPGDLLVTREDASWRTNQRPADLERSLNAFPLKVGEETAGLSLVSLINVTANRKKKRIGERNPLFHPSFRKRNASFGRGSRKKRSGVFTQRHISSCASCSGADNETLAPGKSWRA